MSDDVVVVGSGAAALTAALSAALRGAHVTVLERADLFGGTSAISGGGMWLPGNGLDPDFTDSADDARRYVKQLTLGLVDDAVIDRYLAEAPGIPAFLSGHTALSFWTQIGRPDYHADFDGASGTSRTVFPDTFEMAALGRPGDQSCDGRTGRAASRRCVTMSSSNSSPRAIRTGGNGSSKSGWPRASSCAGARSSAGCLRRACGSACGSRRGRGLASS